MGQRITHKQLIAKVDYLNRSTGRSGTEAIYGIDAAYGGYRIVLRTPLGTEACISPRGTAKETASRLAAMTTILAMEACRVRKVS